MEDLKANEMPNSKPMTFKRYFGKLWIEEESIAA